MSELSISQTIKNQSLTVSAKPLSANIPSLGAQANVAVPNPIADISKQIFDSKIDDLRLQLNTEGLGNFSNTEGDLPTVDPTLFRFIENFANTADTASLAPIKGISDLINNFDFRYFIVESLKLDSIATASLLSFDVEKILSSLADSQDLIANTVDKALSSEILNTDISTISFTKDLESISINSDFNFFLIEPLKTDIAQAISTIALSADKILESAYTVFDLLEVLTNKNLQSSSSNSDLLFFDVEKSLTELLDANDDFLGASFADDDQLADFTKVINNTAHSNDILARTVSFNREAFDTSSISDLVLLNYLKELTSGINQVDLMSMLIDKNLSDVMFISDAVAQAVQKELQTSSLISDDVSSAVSKDILDSTVITDIKVLDVNKSIFELQSVSEAILADINKNLQDTGITNSIFAATVERPFEHISTISDTTIIVANFERSASELNTVSDFNTYLFNKGLIEVIVSSEQTIFNFDKQLVDNAEIVEEIAISPIKVFSDSQLVSDDFNKLTEFVRIVNENLDATDDFQGEALSDDDQITTVIKSINEIIHNAEQVSKSLFRSFTDTVSVSDFLQSISGVVGEQGLSNTSNVADSGSIANQGYFLEDYVQPGYVGTVTTF